MEPEPVDEQPVRKTETRGGDSEEEFEFITDHEFED